MNPVFNDDLKKLFGGMRYRSVSTYLKDKFGEKTIKLAIDGGFTCPNRDGAKGTGGCIFCSDSGSTLLPTLRTKSVFFRTNGRAPNISPTSKIIRIPMRPYPSCGKSITQFLQTRKSKDLSSAPVPTACPKKFWIYCRKSIIRIFYGWNLGCRPFTMKLLASSTAVTI